VKKTRQNILSMIRKKPALHFDSGVDSGVPSTTNVERICSEITLKQKAKKRLRSPQATAAPDIVDPTSCS
jgi:hypothetical protein